MVEDKKAPEIRFNGFEEPWRKFTLGDAISVVSRPIEMDDNATYQCVTAKRRNEGIVSRGFFKGSDILVKSQYRIKSGDYIISKRQVVHGANGIVPDELDDAIVSNEYLVFQDSENMNVRFLATISKLHAMYRAFFLSSYGVHIEKLLFDFEDWKKRSIYLPKTNEQQMITSFFRTLDDAIILKKQQYEKTVNIKKAMLGKMFPRNGADVPEIRFEGFAGAWNRYVLDDLFVERTERSSDGELISVTINSGVVKASSLVRRDSSSEDKSNYKKVEIGDIAYNSMRMWQGASGVSRFSGILSPAYTVIIPNTGVNPLFFSYVFKLPEKIIVFQANSQGMTSDTWNLKFSSLKNIVIECPSYDEQVAIGNFFRNLDTLIESQREELEKLQNIKKACLNKMFV